jgi:hypothetical protein
LMGASLIIFRKPLINRLEQNLLELGKHKKE